MSSGNIGGVARPTRKLRARLETLYGRGFVLRMDRVVEDATTIDAGAAGSGPGNPGYRHKVGPIFYGGTGGGSSNSATGGEGGSCNSPAYGAGGGGGGGGVTVGGRGGAGGPGLVIITCW